MAGSEYQKRQDGNSVVFEVTPASAPKNGGLIILVTLWVLVFGGFALGKESTVGLMLVLVPAGFLVKFALKDGRPKEHQGMSTFRVSSGAIEANGRTFKKDDIHRLIIKNFVSQMTHHLASAAGTVAEAHNNSLKDVANSLELESGGKAYVLAGGMNETTAFGLMTDVAKVVGL